MKFQVRWRCVLVLIWALVAVLLVHFDDVADGCLVALCVCFTYDCEVCGLDSVACVVLAAEGMLVCCRESVPHLCPCWGFSGLGGGMVGNVADAPPCPLVL